MKYLKIALLILGFAFIGCNNSREPKPNILFIAIDDLKPMLGCYGDEVIITPNIDAVAERGTVFLNNHCQQAVCGPSRASLLTGLYPDQSGIWGFYSIREHVPDVITLPQHFRNNGYTTVNISKIFDYRTVDKGMDTISWSWPYFPMGNDMQKWYPEETGPVAAYFYHNPKVQQVFAEKKALVAEEGGNPNQLTHQVIKPATECLDLPDHAYKDGVFALKAMEDLEILASEEKPFFLAVGFERPHLPWTAPKKYWDLYERDSVKLAAFREFAKNDQAYFYTLSNELRSYSDEDGNDAYGKLKDGIPLHDTVQQKLIHGYMAAVSYIDAQVGKMMDKLDSLGLRENTIVVIWGDHGWHLGDHGIWGKSTNFEQATRSPLIISAPGIAPSMTANPSEFVDIYPTLCDLAGIDEPVGSTQSPVSSRQSEVVSTQSTVLSRQLALAGSSLRNLMMGRADTLNRYAFSQFTRDDRMGYAIRDHRYRYVKWVETGRHVDPEADYTNVSHTQLFDYVVDPLEQVNVSGMKEYKAVEAGLQNALDEWLEEIDSR